MFTADGLVWVCFALLWLFLMGLSWDLRKLERRLDAAQQRLRWLETQFDPAPASPESDEDIPF